MLESLLVPLDGSKLSEASLPVAEALAGAAGAAVHLALVHILYEPDSLLGSTQFQFEGVNVEEYDAARRDDDVKYLDGLASRLVADGLSADAKVLDGKPVAEQLSTYADEVGADLILMTTHGFTGVNRMWLGSVADELARHATRPLLLLRPPEDGAPSDGALSIGHVLVPLDGSELAESVLAVATKLASATGARLTLAHVVSVPKYGASPVIMSLSDEHKFPLDSVHEYLDEVAERLRAEGLEVGTHVSRGAMPAKDLAKVAHEVGADLIAMATHGYGGFKRSLLGSVADKLLRSSSLPLLVTRQPQKIR